MLLTGRCTSIQNVTYFITLGPSYTSSAIIWRIDEKGNLKQLNTGANPSGAYLPIPTTGLLGSDGRDAIIGEVNGKLLFVGTDPEVSGNNASADYALSSIDVTSSAPVCALTVSVSMPVTNLCTGITSVLSASATGGTAPLTYQWQRNNTTITGAASATYAASTIGDYTVLVTDDKSCSATSAKLTLTGAKPLTATITGSTTLCIGQPATLSASLSSGTAPYTYQWKQNGNVVGTNAASLSITTGGTYSLSVTDACSATTASFTVTESPSPAVSISGGLAVCMGKSTTLTATATGGTGAYTYQWKQGTTTVGTNAPSLTATGGNSYGLTVTDAKGCAVTSTVSISSGACVTPAVSLPLGGATATAPITLTAITGLTGGADAGVTYQWLLNGNPIVGATNPTYTASASGSYAVVITLSGRATTSPAVVLTINIILAIEPIGLAGNQVVVYPNPTTGECQLTVEVATRQTINLHLLDALGKSVRQWSVPVAPKMSPIRVLLPDADGPYFLRVETETGTVVKKVLRVR